MQPILLGVLGGLGPMSTFRFCELLTSHTRADCDADHIDMLISSRASTPDRTAFILGKSDRSPLPAMQEETDRLVRGGAELIVIPCNTAHYFYDALAAGCPVPMLNIVRETVGQLHRMGVRRFGLLATEGTVRSRSYRRYTEGTGMDCLTPDCREQAVITSIIYGAVKCGKSPDMAAFRAVADSLLARGCEALVLGCTELSLLPKDGLDPAVFIDSLDVLAHRTILACGKEPIGFPAFFDGPKEIAHDV